MIVASTSRLCGIGNRVVRSIVRIILRYYSKHHTPHTTHTMSKEQISATVDDDVKEFLQQDSVNASGLINELVKDYMNGGDDVLEFRKRQVESEYRDLASRAKRKLEEFNRLEEKQKVEINDTVHEAVEIIGGPISDVQAEHWADKADMSVEEFKDEYNNAREQ